MCQLASDRQPWPALSWSYMHCCSIGCVASVWLVACQQVPLQVACCSACFCSCLPWEQRADDLCIGSHTFYCTRRGAPLRTGPRHGCFQGREEQAHAEGYAMYSSTPSATSHTMANAAAVQSNSEACMHRLERCMRGQTCNTARHQQRREAALSSKI